MSYMFSSPSNKNRRRNASSSATSVPSSSPHSDEEPSSTASASSQRRRSDAAQHRGPSLETFLQDSAYQHPIDAWQENNAGFTERIATNYSLPQPSHSYSLPLLAGAIGRGGIPLQLLPFSDTKRTPPPHLGPAPSPYPSSTRASGPPSLIYDDRSTSCAESSVDTEYSKNVQGVRMLKPDTDGVLVQPQLTGPTPMYHCTFSFLDCRFWTPDENDWRLHNLSHFHGIEPPRSLTCPLCDRGFEGTSGGAVWEARMSHLASHLRMGATMVVSRPDFKLFRYLWQKRIIDDAQYKELNSHHRLSVTKSELYGDPTSTTDGPFYIDERRRRIPRYPRLRGEPNPQKRAAPLPENPVGTRETASVQVRSPARTPTADEEAIEETKPRSQVYTVLWDELMEFVSRELQEVEDLLEVIVVTGTEDQAFVAPCVSYAEKMWPALGACLLRSLVSALKLLRSFEPGNSYRDLEIMKDIRLGVSLRVSALLDGECFRENRYYVNFVVHGDDKEHKEFVEILGWLSAAFRIPVPDELLCSQAAYEDWTSYTEIRPGKKRRSNKGGSDRCWHGIFKGYVLAEGFPIPDRGSQHGVELPFDVMTLLGLVLYPVNFGQGIVLKGENTALIPSVCEDDENCVQWHYLDGDGANGPLSWDRIKEHCGNIYPTKDFRLLQSKRSFLGYFPSAKIHLGTRDSGFDKVDFSGAEFDDKTAFVLGNELVGQVGTSVMNFFTAQVSGKLMVHRTAHQRLRGIHDSILDKVRNSKELPILLFDAKTKQGWLVPELSAVLHMALAWASYQHEPDQILSNMPFADARSDGGEAAYDAILRSASALLPGHIQVGDVDGRRVSVLQALAPFFARVGQIKDQQLQRHACGLKETKDLVGYEFKEIASFQEHLQLRRSKIDVDRSGGWLRLVSCKPEMAVILCSHLRAPIQPASTQRTCPLWKTVPTDQYYLTASISSLRQLAKRCGGEETLRLYNDIYCIPAKKDPNPEPCGTGKWPCCNPLLELSKHPSKKALHFDDEGALLIGKALPRTEDHRSLRVFLRSLSPGKDEKAQNGNTPVLQPNRQSLNGVFNIPPPQPSVSSGKP